jgi:hypothetical protein
LLDSSPIPERLQTQSGVVAAPNLGRPNQGPSYAQSPKQSDAYSLDSDTSRPDVVGYTDPFTPAIPPFKRSFAYDTVDSEFRLAVADPTPKPLSIGGKAGPIDDQFFADLNLTLTSDVAVRIPSVGPQARVLAARLIPDVPFELLQDSAENWFIKVSNSSNYRLIMHLSIDRRVFGSPFMEATWEALRPQLPKLPATLAAETRGVREQLGLTEDLSPAAALKLLVRHFRGFAPSDDSPDLQGAALYREIVASKKGVCRHRSFAFVVTALSIGLPARLIRNEAHAWVEVFDSKMWHRIDLGGAAGRMEFDDAAQPQHAAPSDPFAWPNGSESGTDMAERARNARRNGRSPSTDPSPAGAPLTTDPAIAPQGQGEPLPLETRDASEDDEPVQRKSSALVSVTLAVSRATRGARVRIEGQVHTAEAACDLTRVDVRLASDGGQSYALGTLVTNERGQYGGEVMVPTNVPVGDYEVVATTPGSQSCGPGDSTGP